MQLNHRQAPVPPNARGQPAEALDVNVVEDTQLTRKPLPRRLHVRGAGHDKAETAACAQRQPVEFLVG